MCPKEADPSQPSSQLSLSIRVASGVMGRRGSFEASSARKRPRTPRALSPVTEVSGGAGGAISATLLSDAVDREDSRLESSERAAKRKKKGKKKRKAHSKQTPGALLEEIGCGCAQCIAASSTLSRGISRQTSEGGASAGAGAARQANIRLDEKSWLECFDSKHRYGSNLREYYHAWRELGAPGKHFWSWLDSEPLPRLPGLPRERLEREVVTYLTEEERVQYRVHVVDGRFICNDGSLLHTGRASEQNEWIFVLSAGEPQTLYAHRKETRSIPRFHHTSFLAAQPVSVAGKLEVLEGQLHSINLHSGHYRPREDRDLLLFLDVLEDNGVDLAMIRVDVQRLVKSSRHGQPAGGTGGRGATSQQQQQLGGGGGLYAAAGGGGPGPKIHKRHNRKMWQGLHTRWFLEHKQRARGLMKQITAGREDGAVRLRPAMKILLQRLASSSAADDPAACLDVDDAELGVGGKTPPT